MLKLDAVKRCT